MRRRELAGPLWTALGNALTRPHWSVTSGSRVPLNRPLGSPHQRAGRGRVMESFQPKSEKETKAEYHLKIWDLSPMKLWDLSPVKPKSPGTGPGVCALETLPRRPGRAARAEGCLGMVCGRGGGGLPSVTCHLRRPSPPSAPVLLPSPPAPREPPSGVPPAASPHPQTRCDPFTSSSGASSSRKTSPIAR